MKTYAVSNPFLPGVLKNNIILLRFPFSLFLLPVSLFSLMYINTPYTEKIILVFLIWHFLVFPSSNGYNSYHDRDTGPVGGLQHPPAAGTELLYICNTMDISAILLSFLISLEFPLFTAIYIIMSRLYSNRKIRLKKFPVTGFLVVFIFQGMWIFTGNVIALGSVSELTHSAIYAAISCSLLIGSLYPITQIYQHRSDREDGVNSLSMVLGEKGTFLVSGFLFLMAAGSLYITFNYSNQMNYFWLFNLVMFPAVFFFISWSVRSFKNNQHINFRNTMIMLILSSSLINLFFLILLIY